MCLGTIGKIIEINDTIATLDVQGVSIRVSVALLKDVQLGDMVMVHAGCAIAKVDQEEADEFEKLSAEISEAMKQK